MDGSHVQGCTASQWRKQPPLPVMSARGLTHTLSARASLQYVNSLSLSLCSLSSSPSLSASLALFHTFLPSLFLSVSRIFTLFSLTDSPLVSSILSQSQPTLISVSLSYHSLLSLHRFHPLSAIYSPPSVFVVLLFLIDYAQLAFDD